MSASHHTQSIFRAVLIVVHSLSAVNSEESDDSHGGCGDVDDVRNAEVDGEQ